jgi:7,8-dihydroneopterin aldolase/epimerase/oxygenase
MTGDKLFISGLKLQTIIGVHPHERTAIQPVILDIELFLDTTKPGETEDIADYADYDLFVETITQFVTGSAFLLLESLSNKLAKLLLDTYPILQGVTCTISKPEVLEEGALVGVSITRLRKFL